MAQDVQSLQELREARTNQLLRELRAGNLGNECTLQAIIKQILRRCPDARLLCFCTNPQDVRTRQNIAAFPSEAVDKTAKFGWRWPRCRLARIFRIAFQRIPLELIHWAKSLRVVSHTDMLIVNGTRLMSCRTKTLPPRSPQNREPSFR